SSPLQRLVVPEAARIQTDVAAHCAHIAENRRGHGCGSLMQDTIVAANKLGILNGGKRGERANLHSNSRHYMDTLHVINTANVHYISWTEKPLFHGRNKVRAAG